MALTQGAGGAPFAPFPSPVAVPEGGAVVSHAPSQPHRNLATWLSAGCLGLQAAWGLLCYLYVVQAPPENWLAGLAGLLGAAAGVCVLSAIGAAFGIAARHSGWGLITLALNVLAFLAAGTPLLMFFWPRG